MSSDSPALQFGPISNAAEGPLYEQIASAVAREIAAHRLTPGDMLPSVRRLAADLLVSVITIKRAYEELERAGLIYSRQGVGAFVAEQAAARLGSDALAEVKTALGEAIVAARRARLAEPQLFQMLRTMLKEGDQS
jgi:GntR family transcriptional regulator